MLAQIIYTSGTESRPKGAMLTHDAVISEYVSCLVDIEIDIDDRVLHALPLYHCAQLDVFLGPAVYVGATNVITGKPAPANLLSLMARDRINSFFAPPTVWIALMQAPQFEETDLSALRKGYYGASIMPVEVLKEIQRRMPDVRLWNLYGQTEIAPVATVLKPEDQLRKAGSAGRATLNVEIHWSTTTRNDGLPGEIGEIARTLATPLRLVITGRERSVAHSRAAGSTAATSERSTRKATSPSSTRRLLTATVARTPPAGEVEVYPPPIGKPSRRGLAPGLMRIGGGHDRRARPGCALTERALSPCCLWSAGFSLRLLPKRGDPDRRLAGRTPTGSWSLRATSKYATPARKST